MSHSSLKMVVGLGNPGRRYERTRHNAGFMLVDVLAEAYSAPLNKNKFEAQFGKGNIEGCGVVLAKPTAFMNRSGPPVQKLANFFRIPCEEVLVIHDDIDLAFGRIKIKEKGGDGGHKGIRSLIDAFGGDQFIRLRIGVGRSEAGGDVVGHVLGRFDPEEKKQMEKIIAVSKEAVVTILCKGAKEGMNRFNRFKTMI